MTDFRHGLLVGKFYPPHAGHHRAIRQAAHRCDEVTVLVMAAAAETIPLPHRIAWLRTEHVAEPNVRVVGVHCDAPVDVTDERVWTAQVAAMRAGLRAAGVTTLVDAVYCGDDYGAELARRFDGTLVRLVRDGRSGTTVRRDLGAHWWELAPATRADLATRVVVVGAESTGTTTVARELAAHYARRGGAWTETRCVPEYGRAHTAVKLTDDPGLDISEMLWSTDDFDEIATEQTRLEEAAARDGSPLLVCDTDAFATACWERRYLGAGARTGQPWTAVPRRAVYLVTDHRDVPWHDDGMREGDLDVRAAMTDWFVDGLTVAGHSWVLLTGSRDERMQLAIRTVDPLLRLAATFGEPSRGPGFEPTE